MRRVLLLTKGLARGGAEQLLVRATAHGDRDRFQYEVAYLLPRLDELAGDLRTLGVPVHCLDGAAGAGWIGRLERLIRTREIDVVHAHSPYAAVGARARSRRPGGRWPALVYTEHSVWGLYHRATYWANALTYPRNAHVFTVSEEVRRSIRYPLPLRRLPMPPVETLYHGLDPGAVAAWRRSDGVREQLGIPAGVPVVGTVANYRPEKGHHLLLQAAELVRNRIPEARLVLVGRGPTEDQVRAMVRERGLQETVVFAGRELAAPVVAGAFDVFVLASTYEGFPIALTEAMALGKPSVVTRVGGSPEAVRDGTDGLVVPPGDPAALAEAIATLLGDGPLRDRMGKAALRRAAEFDIRRTVRRIEAVYQQLSS